MKNKTTNKKASLLRVLKYVYEDYKFHFLAVFIFIVISALANVRGTLFLQTLIDDYITPYIGQQNVSFTQLLKALLQLASIYACGVLSAYGYNRIMIKVANGTLKRIRDDMFTHMQSLPIKYFDRNAHGDLMSHYTNDIDSLRQMLSQTLPQILNAIISIVSVFVSMVVLSPQLTVITLIMVFIMARASSYVATRSAKHFKGQQRDLGILNGYIEEMMDGQKVIKVFNHEEHTKEEFDVLNENLFKSVQEANTYANFMGPIAVNLGHLTYSVTAIAGSILAITNIISLTIGGLASFLQLTRSFNMPISQITQQFNSIVMALAGADRIFKLLDEQPETDEGFITLVNVENVDGKLVETTKATNHWAWRHPRPNGEVELVEMKGDVRIENVDFGYYEDKIVLHQMNLFALPGQKIAFVGATGAGKTTITNLINRFYDINSGSITYDGIDIKLIKKDDLRRSLGIVLQDTHLFTGSIKDNIRYGKLDATDEEVYAAAKLANADAFIRHLPQGYDTIITGDGASLSQGQRQLLSIARAAVANPPVLILDEATSSIDTRTEAIIQTAMDQLMHGRTVFVIAHRLSTVQNSDAIMVLDHGHIIERGNHDQLIEQKGQYYQLYTGAFELE